jgi:hypothetical protein
MEPHNQGKSGVTMEEPGGQRYEVGTLRVGAVAPCWVWWARSNQRWRLVQRDKRVVWERFWCVVLVGSTKSGLDMLEPVGQDRQHDVS